MADYSAFAAHCAFYRQVRAALDEAQVVDVRRRRSRKVAALLDEHLFRAEHIRELFAEPFTGVDGVELDVPECVAGNFFAVGFHFSNDCLYARTFGDEDVYAVVFVHNLLEARGFLFDVQFHFGNVDCVDVAARLCETESVGEFALREQLAVFRRRCRSQPAAVAPHYFVDNEHTRICAVFGDYVAEEFCALFGCRPCAEALADRVDVVVDGLGKPDYGEFVIVIL